MPYITEEIWQALVNDGTAIMLNDFPVYDEALSFNDDEVKFEKIIEAIKGIRATRNDMNVPPSVKAKVYIETAEQDIFKSGIMFFERLASASEVDIADKWDIQDSVTVVTDCARIFIPLSDIIDTEKENGSIK